jgi:hypothetical protein
LNESFIFGGSWNALVYPFKREDISNYGNYGDYRYFHMFYGGPMIGFHFNQKELINYSLTSTLGGGALIYADWNSSSDSNSQQQNQNEEAVVKDPEYFFVAEPTFLVHVNVTKWFRLAAGISYRYTNGLNNQEISDDDFRRFSFVVASEFGWF